MAILDAVAMLQFLSLTFCGMTSRMCQGDRRVAREEGVVKSGPPQRIESSNQAQRNEASETPVGGERIRNPRKAFCDKPSLDAPKRILTGLPHGRFLFRRSPWIDLPGPRPGGPLCLRGASPPRKSALDRSLAPPVARSLAERARGVAV